MGTILVTVCKSPGKKKSNLGWTPLHLACYFGHKDVVAELLKVRLLFEGLASLFEWLSRVYVRCNAPQAGADVNLPNNIGDTALHKAAFTGRMVRSLSVRCSPLAFFAFVSFSCHSSAESIIHPRIDQEVVMLLLRYDACATIINGTAQIPKDVTQNPEIRTMLEGERYIARPSFISLFGLLSHVWCMPGVLT